MKYRFTEKQRSYMKWKRTLDLILSFGACLVLSPALLLLCIAIKMDSRGPVLFKQKRVGIHKTYFPIYKFRTMRIDTPKDMPTHMLANPDQYITKAGHFLRKSSLDELPQLFNIIKGDMSLVGPRPERPHFVEKFREEVPRYMVKHQVRPGLTGWAQINGRDELESPVKAKLDGEYVKRMSFAFDLRCFLGTFVSVLKADGVYEGGTGEMKKQGKRR